MLRVQRTDFVGPTRGVRETPQGGLCVEAAVARSGVLPYSDGAREWKEYRPPEEVFSVDSLASLRGATVTDQHPAALVTPATFKAVARGNAIGDPRRDGVFVVADLMVQDADLVALVQSGDRREVSCGYTCVVVPTPGVTPEGEHYDAIQTEIRHNHVALLAPGTGRSGPEVSLRLDGAAVQVRRDAAEERAVKYTLKIGGREFKCDAAEDMAAAQTAVDAGSTELAEVKAALMTALQKVAAMEAKQVAASAAAPPAATPPTEADVPEVVQDAIIKNRGALVATARQVLGAEAKLDGLKADEIRRLVVAKAHPEMKLDGLSADTVGGMFLATTSGTTTHNDALAAAHRIAAGPTGRTDGGDDPQATAAKTTTERWQQPLTRGATKGS